MITEHAYVIAGQPPSPYDSGLYTEARKGIVDAHVVMYIDASM